MCVRVTLYAQCVTSHFVLSIAMGSMTPEQMQAWRWEQELDERNRPLSDDELDALFPQDGYKVCCVLACDK